MTTLEREREDDLASSGSDGRSLEPPASPGGIAGGRGRRLRRPSVPTAVAATLALAAGTWAVVGSQLVLPHLSINRDETVYLLQADALRDGHLFPPAPDPAASFTPWFAVESAGRFILKYTPVHAASLALGRVLLGSERATLGVLAAAAVFLLYLLGAEVLPNRRQAALAAGLFTISPLFVIQSITFLSYIGNVVLLLAFSVALLRGVRTGRRRWLVLAGLAVGLAFFARPFDAVIFGGPIGIWFLAHHRTDLTRLARRLGWFTFGVLPPLVATLLFNRIATGSPLEFPFSLLEPLDTIGFGPRRLLPTDPVLDYSPGYALRTFVDYGSLLTRWVGGGVILIALALPGLWRSRGSLLAIAAIGVTVPVGYVFFWGPANVIWMTYYLGPFYYLTLLVPLSLLGGLGLARLARWSRPIGVAALVAVVACAGAVSERVVRENVRASTIPEAVQEPFEDVELDDAVVFLPGSTLLNPFGFARNDPSFDGDVVWSLDRDVANLDVLERFPGRTPYTLRLPAIFGGEVAPGREQRLQLEQLQVLQARSIEWPIRAQNRAPLEVFAVEVALDDADGTASTPEVLVVDKRSRVGKVHEGTLRLSASGVSFTSPGAAVARSTTSPLSEEGVVTVTFTVSDGTRSAVRPLGAVRVPYRVVGGELVVLAGTEASGAVGAPVGGSASS